MLAKATVKALKRILDCPHRKPDVQWNGDESLSLNQFDGYTIYEVEVKP